MTAQPTAKDGGDRLITAQQLADYLDIPLATIYAWRYRHQGPPGFRVGRHLRFRWRDIEDWIGQRVQAGES